MTMEGTLTLHKNFSPVDGILVFCREDPRVAKTAARLYREHNPRWILLTGGIGKGSGAGSRALGSEARHQAHLLINTHNIPPNVLSYEHRARNGAENSRFSIDLIRQLDLPHRRIILLVDPRSARRVVAAHTWIARTEKKFATDYAVVCTDDSPFDASDPSQAREVVEEIMRVADWPSKGWSDHQWDLPPQLVEWARQYVPV
jgi:hypothetical protein